MIPEKIEDFIDRVITGDATKLINSIPDESIDLILCDPVYNEVWQYDWLATIAYRVLKPYGSVIAQTGHIYRWEAEQAMQRVGLIKRPLITEIFTGGFVTIWKHKTLRANHWFIWLEKTGINPDRGWIKSFLWGSKDKSKHRWGDGERGFLYLVQQLTQRGDTILDPFTGTGTVPAVCKILDRRFIAFEIDPEQAEQARRRIAETNPPLLIPEMEQASFLEEENDE